MRVTRSGGSVWSAAAGIVTTASDPTTRYDKWDEQTAGRASGHVSLP